MYLKCDTLIIAEFLKTYLEMYLEICQLDRANFLSAPGLAWQVALNSTKVELELLTDIDMLSMVEKGIRGEICHFINRYVKANNKCLKHHDKNKEGHILNIGILIICMVGQSHKSC